MNPSTWGPPGWRFLHSVTLAYPLKPTLQQKNETKRFFLDLKNVIPCSTCREHYKGHLAKRPITDKVLANRQNLVCWLIDIHNDVNRMLKKPVMKYNTAIKLYQTK